MLSGEGTSFHFIDAADYESVAERGLLCYLIRKKWGLCQGRAYKAQRQVGTDLISLWDPWSFLRRHWRVHPLGSENRPWEIIDFRLDEHFRQPDELELACSLREPNEIGWLGEEACQDRSRRKQLDHVRRVIAKLAKIPGPTPGLMETDVRNWINLTIQDWGQDPARCRHELCVFLAPQVHKYHFPGYKTFENFARCRIHPSYILGVVASCLLPDAAAIQQVAQSHGHRFLEVNRTQSISL